MGTRLALLEKFIRLRYLSSIFTPLKYYPNHPNLREETQDKNHRL